MQIAGTWEGVILIAGQAYTLPLGSTVNVFVYSDEEKRFKQWSAPGTMIDGSGLPEESFVVTGPVTVKPVEKQEVAVLIRYGVGAPEVYATELEGTLVKLPAGQIEVPAQNGTKGFSLASGWTMAGHDGAAIEIYQGTSSGPSRTATMVSSGGGQTLGMGATSSSGHQISVLAGPVAIAAVTAETCMYYSWKYMGYPRVGYVWPGPYYGLGLSACLAAGTATAEFVKKPELTLEVTVEGGGAPKCAGYVKAQAAKKYYAPNELVMLTAESNPGYVHTGWKGDGVAWLGIDQLGELEEPPMALKDITASEIYIQISDATPPKNRTVTAVFAKLAPVSVEFNAWVLWNLMNTAPYIPEPLPDYYSGDGRLRGEEGTSRVSIRFELDPVHGIIPEPGYFPFVVGSDGYDSSSIENSGIENCNLPGYKYKVKDGHSPDCPDDVPSLEENTVEVTAEKLDGCIWKVDIDIHIGPGCVPWIAEPLVAELDAQITLLFYPNTSSVLYSVDGKHDGFPWYELKLNEEEVYGYDDCASGSGVHGLFPPMGISIPAALPQPVPNQ